MYAVKIASIIFSTFVKGLLAFLVGLGMKWGLKMGFLALVHAHPELPSTKCNSGSAGLSSNTSVSCNPSAQHSVREEFVDPFFFQNMY